MLLLPFQRIDIDLGPGDYLSVLDGELPSGEELMRYIEDGLSQPKFVITVSNAAYISLSTNSEEAGRGFLLGYQMGSIIIIIIRRRRRRRMIIIMIIIIIIYSEYSESTN